MNKDKLTNAGKPVWEYVMCASREPAACVTGTVMLVKGATSVDEMMDILRKVEPTDESADNLAPTNSCLVSLVERERCKEPKATVAVSLRTQPLADHREAWAMQQVIRLEDATRHIPVDIGNVREIARELAAMDAPDARAVQVGETYFDLKLVRAVIRAAGSKDATIEVYKRAPHIPGFIRMDGYMGLVMSFRSSL